MIQKPDKPDLSSIPIKIMLFGRDWAICESKLLQVFILGITTNLKKVVILNVHALYTTTFAPKSYQNTHSLRKLWLE
jgi:hypothetical protein